ncbi:hypothetical protein, unlikely [Trypanosoma congolense IL3000]|uniref:Uncharacterized protein n=1 Tax=Trypanosoma congolense (strain IL3000) TaxID=1068625 RepID=F9WEW2_TRYCI|nr:hypothetical protein, unlikely [Trypanosoma congolense IL3000]
MPSAKLIVRCRHSNFQPVRDKQLSASLYRRPFQSRSRLEPGELCQKGNKAPATAVTQRLGHSATHLNKALTRKESKGMRVLREEMPIRMKGQQQTQGHNTAAPTRRRTYTHTRNVNYQNRRKNKSHKPKALKYKQNNG